ncbi:class I SAM-dependent methyltransferase [Caproiciproducens galactitolivorans]|uniref:Glycine/sarcosine N-methyltransferase n=1 Tax=Caproiciproducens galactitolivorans TaxID=642589 RepID=A0A4Z0YAL4_9FIRM|nr:class I SAM-dependent methyltransferase [Caproiciproducens galactitolivorans]QEY34062.1 class I SAM-dependent methyltransferase [Caproiciproducens galactitolivorans]TGJ76525.1 glycine/sarcosine N-methyltransferase [Caproiciproducens galactitolivorans]
MSYSAFARYYDNLTQNVGYSERADYICALLKRFKHDAGLTLDLACGTGSLTIELAKRKIDVYGIDASASMLSVAQQKAAENGLQLLFLCQKMQNIDLYGTVDTVICMLDSINHLTSERDVQKTFSRVSLFLNPGGYFLFDINTLYKHQYVLGNHTFVYDTDEVYCVWQNSFDEKTGRVGIMLDFFERDGCTYRRASEHFYERAYDIQKILSMLTQAGLETVGLFDDLSFEKPGDQAERIVVVAKKV